MSNQLPPELTVYCGCMERVKHHLRIIKGVLSGSVIVQSHPDHEMLRAEAIFMHFRKALEEIAFASLTANREKYAAARPSFATDWSTSGILKDVAKVNPDFYPLPLYEPIEIAPGRKHFEPRTDGFLTKEDFDRLYKITSDAIHAPNPFSPLTTINTQYPVQEWIGRIGRLLGCHIMQIPDLQGLWLIQVPGDGPTHAFLAAADGPFIVE